MKELNYLLGYFYADGCLCGKTKGYYYPSLEILRSDSHSVIKCLESIKSNFTLKHRTRKNSTKDQTCINILSKDKNINLFKQVMIDKINMKNILSAIDISYLNYFIRGFFDGDGCISISKSNHSRLYFYGSFDQKWDLLFDIFRQLNIKYAYQKITRKNGLHKSSFICISNKHGINILYEYMYPNRVYDFGLSRKYEKLNSIKNLIKSKHIKEYDEIQNLDIVKIYS